MNLQKWIQYWKFGVQASDVAMFLNSYTALAVPFTAIALLNGVRAKTGQIVTDDLELL
jgi:hypothetical protein